MEGTEIIAPAKTNMPEITQLVNKTKIFWDKPGIKDKEVGQKIKDIADNVGIIGSFGALVLGVLFWSRAEDLIGFLGGLAVVAVGVAVSFSLMSLLYKYADIVSSAIEQSEAQMKLEAQKTEEMLRVAAEEAQQRLNDARDETELEAADEILLMEQDSIEQYEAEEQGSTGALDQAKVRNENSELPIQADTVDRMRRVAHFYERSDAGVICPVCTKWQTSKHDACFHCNCEFVFDDEQSI